MVDIQPPTAEIRRGKKIDWRRRNHRWKYNVRISYAGRPQKYCTAQCNRNYS